MFRRKLFGCCGLVLTALSPALLAPPVPGQGLRNVIRSGDRLFPGVGAGVAALKRDSSGRYYILAEPPDKILLFDAAGKPAGQIPNANSRGATIAYAVDIDIDARGNLFVVDRGANAVKVFTPAGSLAATVHVLAPTSIVALPDGQFALTTLQSSRLVQVMNERGVVVRSFGDPADQPNQNPTAQQDQGAVAQPILDRGRIVGDSVGNIYFSFAELPDPTIQKFDRFGYSAYETAVTADKFGPNLRGSSPVQFGFTMSALGWPTGISAWTDLHSLTSLSFGGGMRRGQRGQAAAATAGTATGPGAGPGQGQVDTQGNALDFTASSDDLADSNAAYDPTTVTSFNDLGQGFIPPGAMGAGMFGGGLGFHGGFHGGMPGVGMPGESAENRPKPPDGELGGPDHFWHGHPGMDFYRASAAMKVTFDTPPSVTEKPAISAVGVDPETQEAWAAIQDTLVHFDKNGNPVDIYYLTLKNGESIKPTAVLVEPTRFLIASDPWGIYEFPRPDKAAAPQAAPQRDVVPEQVQPASAPSGGGADPSHR